MDGSYSGLALQETRMNQKKVTQIMKRLFNLKFDLFLNPAKKFRAKIKSKHDSLTFISIQRSQHVIIREPFTSKL